MRQGGGVIRRLCPLTAVPGRRSSATTRTGLMRSGCSQPPTARAQLALNPQMRACGQAQLAVTPHRVAHEATRSCPRLHARGWASPTATRARSHAQLAVTPHRFAHETTRSWPFPHGCTHAAGPHPQTRARSHVQLAHAAGLTPKHPPCACGQAPRPLSAPPPARGRGRCCTPRQPPPRLQAAPLGTRPARGGQGLGCLLTFTEEGRRFVTSPSSYVACRATRAHGQGLACVCVHCQQHPPIPHHLWCAAPPLACLEKKGNRLSEQRRHCRPGLIHRQRHMPLLWYSSDALPPHLVHVAVRAPPRRHAPALQDEPLQQAVRLLRVAGGLVHLGRRDMVELGESAASAGRRVCRVFHQRKRGLCAPGGCAPAARSRRP